MGQDTWAQWLSKVIISHVLCTRLSIFKSTAGPVPEYLVPIPCMKLHVLTTYRKVTVTQKNGPFDFHLHIHASTNKIPSLASHPLSLSLTFSGFLSKNGTVFILYWCWLLQIIHMFLFVQDRTIIKGALEPKVTVWPALTSAKRKVLESLGPWSRSCYSVCI